MRCCSCTSGLAEAWLSIVSFSLLMSSRAASKFWGRGKGGAEGSEEV